MNETVNLTQDGILEIITQEDDYKKVVRYFDSSRNMLLDILEETPQKRVLTKYQEDGFHIQSIEVTQGLVFVRYQADGKTRQFQRETLPDGTIQSITYRQDGQTPERITIEDNLGCVTTTKYQPDGESVAMLIESDSDGLTKTTTYRSNGVDVFQIQEDLADGAIQITQFREDKTREKVFLKHLKDAPEGLVREVIFDNKGVNVIETKDILNETHQ